MMLLWIILAGVIIVSSLVDTEESLVFANNQDCGTVYTAVGDTFTVKIAFKNTGNTEGT